MLRLLVVSLSAALALLLSTPAADACKCVPKSGDEYVQAADRVLVVRAGADKKVKAGFERSFEVLHAIKGEGGKTFTWTRSEENPLCGPSYQSGDVAVLFVIKGELGLCAGNFGITSQIEDLPAYVKAAGGKTGAVSLAAMKAALGGALKSYLHDRPTVPVLYAPLSGQNITLGKSRLTFRNAPARASKGNKAKNVVVVGEAFSFGPLTYVWGHYAIEGYSFRALVLESGDKEPAVLHVSGAER